MPAPRHIRLTIDAAHAIAGRRSDLRAAAAIVRALAPAGPSRRWTILRLAEAIADLGERAEGVLERAGL